MQASLVLWRLMLCFMIFSLANFAKSLVTKLLSTHFYRTAHFKKVKQAIEKVGTCSALLVVSSHA